MLQTTLASNQLKLTILTAKLYIIPCITSNKNVFFSHNLHEPEAYNPVCKCLFVRSARRRTYTKAGSGPLRNLSLF